VTSSDVQRARLGIGYLPQEASIFPLNVDRKHSRRAGSCRPNRRRREHDSTALLEEIQPHPSAQNADHRPIGRERRRVEIARALATRPAYMLLERAVRRGIDPIASETFRPWCAT